MAVQEQRVVVCFIKGNDKESCEWESSYFEQAEVLLSAEGSKTLLIMFQVKQSLKAHAVVFRLQADSQEASFLSAFCSISSTPTLVVIKYDCLLVTCSV